MTVLAQALAQRAAKAAQPLGERYRHTMRPLRGREAGLEASVMAVVGRASVAPAGPPTRSVKTAPSKRAPGRKTHSQLRSAHIEIPMSPIRRTVATSRRVVTAHKIASAASAARRPSAPLEGGKTSSSRKAMRVGVRRAREWSSEVERMWRFQRAGWRDHLEYEECSGREAECWGEEGWPKCLEVKDHKRWLYFGHARECEDRLLSTVKLFDYA
jgi:hypothetical protein